MKYGIFVKNSKTGRVSRAMPGLALTRSEAAKLSTSLDMKCKAHLCYWSAPLTDEPGKKAGKSAKK